MAIEDEHKGLRGKFLRDAAGKVEQIDLGGRLAQRA
jgi:hypothetical protein